MRNGRTQKLFNIIIFLIFTAQNASAQIDAFTLRSALILKMINFIEWPTNSRQSIEIAVIGDEQCFTPLQAASTATINGKTLSVVKKSVDELNENTQIVYACTGYEILKKIADKLKNKPVLTVTSDASAIHAGFIINFFEEDNKVRFEINNDRAKLSEIRISSQLLKLSKSSGGVQ